jgi:hypothetical protein
MEKAPPPKTSATQGEVVAAKPVVPPAAASMTGSASKGLEKSEAPSVRIDAIATKADPSPANVDTPVRKADPPSAKADPPLAKTPTKVAVSPATEEQARKKESAAPVPAKPAAAPLDLTSLETRLRETNAIGVFTKLTLKNQVDDLLERFRAYYQGRIKISLAELRQPYDLLILKVLSLLQDRDPSLAKAILASREEIWGILSDPVKFSAL